jgi:DNA topoisomerase-6 subunit B
VLEEGLRSAYSAEFYSTSVRDTGSRSGDPFLVEAGIVYDSEEFNQDSQINLDRFANRVPLVYHQGACSITQTIERIGWRNYSPSGDSSIKQSGGSGILQGPFVIVVHVASTNVPFTSESKDAVAGSGEIEHEIEQAV